MYLSPIIFIIILPPNSRGKNPTNSQISPGPTDKIWNSKGHTIKILLDRDASASIVCK